MGVGDLYNVLFVTFCLGEGGGGGPCIPLMAPLLHDPWKNSKRGGGRGQIKSEADFMTVPQRLS
jgi:hypothetical protein